MIHHRKGLGQGRQCIPGWDPGCTTPGLDPVAQQAAINDLFAMAGASSNTGLMPNVGTTPGGAVGGAITSGLTQALVQYYVPWIIGGVLVLFLLTSRR